MSAAVARPIRSAMLGEALRRCETTPCAGLQVTAPGVPRIAAAWLDEAANIGGGLVWQPDGASIWLLGAAPTPCRRASDLIAGMGWTARLLEFPRDLNLIEDAVAAEPATIAASPPGAAGLEDRVARLPAEAGQVLATLWRMGPAGPLLLAQRWMAEPAALPAPPGADWGGHLTALLAGRLLARAGRGDWPAPRKPNLPLLIDMPWMPPPATLPAPPAGAGHGLVLPLAGLADADAWQMLAAAAGWGLAWSGLVPSLAHLLDSLPGGFVFAAPGEAGPWPRSPRLVLSGVTDRAALAQALAGGVAIASAIGE